MNNNERTHLTPASSLHQVPLTRAGQDGGGEFALEVGQRLGGYQLQALLGKGGMGQVYLAEQLYPVQRQVALKFMQRRISDLAAAARFDIERQALARMSHPAIAQVYEAGTTADGYPYLAMEYVPGEPFDWACLKRGLPLRERLALFVQLCRGVRHAHQRGILHLDIKPANVLLTEVDGVLIPKLIDFGLAISAARAQGRQSYGSVGGTRGYMSPEQLGIAFDEGLAEIDVRSDVYALGVLLYQIVAGITPFVPEQFVGNDIEALRRAFETSSPLPLSAQLRAAGRPADARLAQGDLDAIVARAMSLRRSVRYESVSDLSADVSAFLAHRPVAARAPGAVHRAGLFLRRHRWPVLVATLLCASLLGGLALAVSGFLAARVERDLAAARQAELERVSAFQQDMLAELDAAALGQRLQNALIGQFERAAKDRNDDRSAAFVRDLALANPTEAARQLLDSELLARALDTIDSEFVDQPRVAAELKHSIARAYAGIGRIQPALATADAAMALWRQSGGGESEPQMLQMRLSSAEFRNSLGGGGEQLAPIEQLIADARASGDARVELMADLLRLRVAGYGGGKLADSVTGARALLPRFDAVFGVDSVESTEALLAVAALMGRAAQHDAARPLLEDAMARSERAAGPDSRRRLTCLEQLAINTALLGDNERALAMFEELLAARRRVQGNEHPSTLQAMNALAVTLRRLERSEEAIPIGREALEVRQRTLGADHPDTLRSQLNLGSFYADVGDISQAQTLTEAVYQGRLRTLGRDNPDVYTAAQNLADFELALGRVDVALRYAEETYRERERLLGAQHVETLQSLPVLARALASAGRCERAIPMLEAERRASGDDVSPRAQAMAAFYLSECYLATGRRDEAEALESAMAALIDTPLVELNPPQRFAREQLLKRRAAK